ncbi:molybdopterin molybdotransferase MoeA [Demequina sp. SYSU T00039]|uniref:Molybdopterin molybdenumtransferase n=1 Tax=Demequina lignilytica TaxID=3051663 RepID=A0AAW7M7N0_9MICO|nr:MULTISPECIES: gephyrin-like molybdotransferase Glp [unclassified Demequina]MDN4478428.1 molybdopterin molybdotransferase MoeA [Demequina sp. SYSU T00039-1]MDN4487065.1 molybdopterin molybdotransferase MoeA [Demequina sp. SYSU T00039]
MRSVVEHRAAALTLAGAPRSEQVPAAAALGRVLAHDVRTLVDVPSFTNSAMDGYAVRVAEAAAGAILPVSADIPAGVFPAPLAPGTAARIMTGAPVPQGADAVVPREVTDDGLERVRVTVAPAPGAHIRLAGEDARAGDLVLGAGTVLTPPRLAAIAGAGHAEVSVRARPRVVVVSTGDELRAPGEELAPGQIFDSNSTLMAALVEQAGGEVAAALRLGDDPVAFLAAVETASAGCDLILTAGGVSVGAYDVVKAALADAGVEFVPVAMQPGKPQGLGRVGRVPIACLPGNPVSVAASFTAFVEPLLRTMLGLPAREPEAAVAGEGWVSPPGREQRIPVVIEPPVPGGTAAPVVRPATAGGSRSHLGLRLAVAEGWAIVPPDVQRVEAGDSVGLMRFLP